MSTIVEVVDQLEHSYTAGENVKWYNRYEKLFVSNLQN